MEEFWLRALREAEEAEATARWLRQRYGRNAEAHLSDAVRAPVTEKAARTRMDDVRRALRWT